MGLLTVINIFTVIWLLLLPVPLGYLFKVIKTSFRGFDELPEFNNWKSIYLDGIKLIAVIIIYALPFILPIFLINYDWILPIDPSKLSLVNLWPLFMGPQFLIFLAIGLIEYMAIANMALYEGEISAAFSFRAIVKRISLMGWKNYLIYYFIIWIIAVVTVLISYLALLMVIGIVIIPLVIIPYFMIFNSRYLAMIFASSEDNDAKKDD